MNFELVTGDQAVNTDLYVGQLHRVYGALKSGIGQSKRRSLGCWRYCLNLPTVQIFHRRLTFSELWRISYAERADVDEVEDVRREVCYML